MLVMQNMRWPDMGQAAETVIKREDLHMTITRPAGL